METYIIWLIVAESVLLLVISILLFKKTSSINKLINEIHELKSHGGAGSFLDGKNDFIPVLVHELRAPLSVIKGASDLLLKDAGKLDAEQIHTLLAQTKESSNAMLKLVADILDVSKIGSGRFEINKVFTNINDVLREECSYFNPVAQVKKIEMKVNLEQDFPNFSFDPERIKQVMNNLLSNAIKYTPEGGSVQVCSRKFDHHIEVVVADTGIGIPSKDKDNLFKPFMQASNHGQTKESGTGLGLVIAKAIIESHKGNIWAEDNGSQGTKFIFTLPLE